ncbi:hypothetical protein PTSG_01696 [Salpingoeca rosetta]|uniref:HAD family phosphatase n=1 Tax=Salpingoeca rosetta (strain ATCC 50818 / BSB-021) TaxID=946362 RepID=F2TYP2_SALR5|nr:uncharacterized protein PTSG_01696 [Salpingoeca rosetta]EGD78716.1 hypothetical protein PTSG_01696 [Salpingoeca rosetta]|eukprot:XP_004997673.1 hypothetical protein PTSG_01696 [Salpingoeca rosetta]
MRSVLRRLSAVLFDLDGTLVHTDHLHYQAWQQIGKEIGLSISSDQYEETISGRQNPPVLRELKPELPEPEVQELSLRKEALFRELAAQCTDPVDGIVQFLEALDDAGVPKCLVTNAPRINVDMMLQGSKLDRFFPTSHQILGDECTHAKPHPEPYLQGLKLLNAQGSRAVAFEDSIAGASAAIKAGIPTIGVLTTLNPAAMTKAGVAATIQDYTEQFLLSTLNSIK